MICLKSEAVIYRQNISNFIKKVDITKKCREKVKVITQESVRNRLLEKTYAYRQKNISDVTGIPVEIISKFMNGKRELYDSSLKVLNDYLNTH